VNGSYVDASSIASISGNTITLNLTDGGFGDEDGLANGVILDPLVPIKKVAGSAPSIVHSPKSVTVASGATLELSAAASGSPAPSVQWQSSTNKGVTFADIPGATSTTFSTSVSPAMNGLLFRAVFSNGVGSPVSTTSAKLTVFFITSVLPSGQRGIEYRQQLHVNGGVARFYWSAPKGLPKGLSLSSSGVLSGRPSRNMKVGTYQIVVQVHDSTPKSPLSLIATLSLQLK
jgi:hypothetical protein